jgi:hypothetical protein
MANVAVQQISNLVFTTSAEKLDLLPIVKLNIDGTKTTKKIQVVDFINTGLGRTSNTFTLASNNVANVAFFSFSNSNFLSMDVRAQDANNYTKSDILLVTDGTNINTTIQSTSIGNNAIIFVGAVLNGSNIDLLFTRGSNTVANVNFSYTAILE